VLLEFCHRAGFKIPTSRVLGRKQIILKSIDLAFSTLRYWSRWMVILKQDHMYAGFILRAHKNQTSEEYYNKYTSSKLVVPFLNRLLLPLII
jgi:hypothetical protein